MALEQLEMETGLNKVEFALTLLQTWEPKETVKQGRWNYDVI